MFSSRKYPAQLFLLILTIACIGCADRSKIKQRSIAELYTEALNSTHRLETVSTPGPPDRLPDHPEPYPLTTTTFESDPSAQSTANDTARPLPTGPKLKKLALLDSSERNETSLQFLNGSVDSSSVQLAFSQEALASVPQSPGIVSEAPPFPGYDSVAGGTKQAELISEFFDQMDVRDAINIIAEINGDEVIMDEGLGGLVTTHIDNATFPDALRALLMPLGYVFAVREGKYIVAPPDPDSPLFRHVAERTLYSPLSRKSSMLTELLPSRFQDFYQASDDHNLIVIEAPAEISCEILARLQELDQPVQQVVLEAIVCVSAPDSGFRFGMDWNHALALNSADQVNVGLSGLALNAAASPYGLQNAFDDFSVTSAFVQLLSQQGYVTIRAQPRVTAKDGEKASISIARETFFSLQPSGSNVLFRQDVQKVDAGISLDITPRVRGNMISVEIERAEVSEDIRSNDSSPELNSNPYPIINRRLVSTKVDVQDGHTIVIGGLVQRQTVDRINRIPFLGSIPGVGVFFRTVEKQEQDAEVAIFISPTIVH